MGFFDTREGVEQYISMCEGYAGDDLVPSLHRFLTTGSTVLELGMGPGRDLDLISKDYQATGSDSSQIFLEIYQEKYPKADLLQLDAVTLQTERRFDAIFSNKVLHHLPRVDFHKSLLRQFDLLQPEGLICHSLWCGKGEEVKQELLFTRYEEEELQKLLLPDFMLLEMQRYSEMEDGDSLYFIAKKRGMRA